MDLTFTMQVRLDSQETIFVRPIDAPRDSVFDCFLEPRLIEAWWAPPGFLVHCQNDPRPGGEYFLKMRSPGRVLYPLYGIYLQIVRPQSLVFTQVVDKYPPAWLRRVAMARRRSGTPHPSLMTTLALAERAEGKTTHLTMRTRFQSSLDRDAYMQAGLAQDWAEALERLQEFLREG